MILAAWKKITKKICYLFVQMELQIIICSPAAQITIVKRQKKRDKTTHTAREYLLRETTKNSSEYAAKRKIRWSR